MFEVQKMAGKMENLYHKQRKDQMLKKTNYRGIHRIYEINQAKDKNSGN